MYRYIWNVGKTRTFNPSPAEPRHAFPFANSVDPDQLASSEAN